MSNNTNFSSSLFTLNIDSVVNSAISVLSFQNKTETPQQGVALIGSYQFLIKIKNDLSTILPDLTNKKAYFQIGNADPTSGSNNYFYGVISAVKQLGPAPVEFYELTLSSPLHPMTCNSVSRSYLSMTLTDVFTQVLQRNGWASDEYKFYFNTPLPTIEFVVQYNESDYDFIQRLLMYYGVFYKLSQNGFGYRLEFYDDINTLSGNITLPFALPSSTARPNTSIYTMREDWRSLTKTVVQRSYNPDSPSDTLETTYTSQSTVPSQGTMYYPLGGYTDANLGQVLTQRRVEAIDPLRCTATITTDCLTLVPGQIVQVTDHPVPTFNRSYRIIQIQHEGNQAAGIGYEQGKSRYKNTVIMIPTQTPYRPPYKPNTNYHGYITATIETAGGTQAFIDEQGYYRIRPHFDSTPNSAGSASPPTRLSQPLTGDNFGFHFPLLPGTEVLLVCQNGDLNQPVILGTIPNPNQQSPVTNANPTQHILSSAGGHQLLMDDNANNPRIQLNTPGGNNRLELNSPKGNHSVKLISEQGNVALKTAKHLSIKADQNINKHVGGNHNITVGGRHTVNAKTGNFNLNSGANIIQTAEQGPMTLTAGNNINLNAGQNLIAQVAGSMNLITSEGDISVSAEQGGIYGQIGKALNITGTGQGKIIFKQVNGNKTSSIVFEPDGSIVVTAKNVNLIAKQNVTMTGHNFQHQGPQQVASDPLKVPDCMLPSVDMNLSNAPVLSLPPRVFVSKQVIYTYTVSFTGNVTLTKEDACNPISVNPEGITLEAKQALGEYLNQTNITFSPDTYKATLSLSSSTQLVTTTVLTDPDNPMHFALIASTETIKDQYENWIISNKLGVRIDVYVQPKPPESSMANMQAEMISTAQMVEYGFPLPPDVVQGLQTFFDAHKGVVLTLAGAGLIIIFPEAIPAILTFVGLGSQVAATA